LSKEKVLVLFKPRQHRPGCAIAEYRYDISVRHYLDGFQYLYRFAGEGACSATAR